MRWKMELKNLSEKNFQLAKDFAAFADELEKANGRTFLVREFIASASYLCASIAEREVDDDPKEIRWAINHIMRRSVNTRFWLTVIKDSNLIDPNACARFITQVDALLEICKDLKKELL